VVAVGEFAQAELVDLDQQRAQGWFQRLRVASRSGAAAL
jgi:hypothetical protein